MLISLLLIVYNLCIAFFSGLVFTRLIAKASGCSFTPFHPSVYVLCGWVFITLQLQIIHLFIPVDLKAHLFVWAVSILIALTSFKTHAKDAVASIYFIANKKNIGFAVIFIVIGVLNICTRKADGDIGDYHLQAIKWIEEYRVVPGIGNLVRQLGNNSNWFLLNAFSGMSFLGLKSVYVVNVCLVLITGLYVLPFLTQKFWMRNFILFCYLLVVVTRKYTGAVTNDVAITCCTIILFCWFTDLVSSQQNKPFDFVLLIILSFSLITIKLSALPMLLFAAGIFWLMFKRKNISLKIFATLIGFALLLYIPWLITNVYHSGYLAFPVGGTNISGTDWEMRSEIIDYEKLLNLVYARTQGIDLGVDMETIAKMPFSQWFPIWFKAIDGFSKLMVSANALLLPLLVVLLAANKKFRQWFFSSQLWIVAVTIIIALSLWFTHGPNTRFVFGYMVFVVAMGIDILHINPLIKITHKYQNQLIASLAGLMFGMFVYSNFSTDSFAKLVLYPPPYHQPAIEKLQVDGGVLNVTSPEEQSWDSPLPCTSWPDKDLQFRGTDMEDGFRIKR